MTDNAAKQKILIIDDEPLIRDLFTIFLEEKDYQVLTADNGNTGLEVAVTERPDLILTDLNMPESDGFSVINRIREMDLELPVIIISGAGSLDLAVKALRQGAWDYLIKPLQDMSILTHTIEKCLEKARLIRDNREYHMRLEELVNRRTKQLERRNHQLDISRRQIIGILSQAAEYRDFETGDHFLRVSEFSACIAENMGWDTESVSMIRLASPVHDIGKIGIPDSILLKEGKLTPEEWETMQKHTIFGKNILKSNKFVNTFIHDTGDEEDLELYGEKLIEIAANIALSHHERWDGTGYPLGLNGEEIPREARITAVADVYDALRSRRPYKEPWPEKESLDYISKEAGKQFDPEVVRIFMENIEEIHRIRETFNG